MVASLPDDMGPIDPAKRDPDLPPAKSAARAEVELEKCLGAAAVGGRPPRRRRGGAAVRAKATVL